MIHAVSQAYHLRLKIFPLNIFVLQSLWLGHQDLTVAHEVFYRVWHRRALCTFQDKGERFYSDKTSRQV